MEQEKFNSVGSEMTFGRFAKEAKKMMLVVGHAGEGSLAAVMGVARENNLAVRVIAPHDASVHLSVKNLPLPVPPLPLDVPHLSNRRARRKHLNKSKK